VSYRAGFRPCAVDAQTKPWDDGGPEGTMPGPATVWHAEGEEWNAASLVAANKQSGRAREVGSGEARQTARPVRGGSGSARRTVCMRGKTKTHADMLDVGGSEAERSPQARRG